MHNKFRGHLFGTVLTIGAIVLGTASAAAAVRIEGEVQAGDGPVAQSAVTLWAAGTNAPTQLVPLHSDYDSFAVPG